MVLDRLLLCLLWLYVPTLSGVIGLSVVVSPSPTVQVVSGQTLSITCQWSADYTGPNAAVNYRLNDGGGEIGTLFINFGTCIPVTAPPYTLTCNKDTRTLGIQIPANSYSHGDRWTCEGRNDAFDNTTPPQTDTTTVEVRVPVTSVTITPSTTVTVDVGTSTTLSCTTQPHSRPTASVTWYRVVSGQPQQITTNISVSHDTQNSAQTTTSALFYVPSKEDNGRTVYCVSDGGWTGSTDTTLESARVSLNVRYPPLDPVIVTGNSDPVYDGANIDLRCSIRGGNPLANVIWTCPGHGVTSTPANTADTAVSVLRIALTPLYNGANCTCTATHPVQGFRTSHTEVFNVYFAPRMHALTVTDPFPWLARDDNLGHLSCDTTPGNPSITRYTWYRDGTPINSQTSQVISFNPPTSSDNGRLYKCRAENDFTDARGSAPELEITLDVQYAPIITLLACPDTVNETDNYRCTCTAVGNPNPTVTWYPRDLSTNNILDLPSINRNKAGRYTCNATSSSQKFGTLYTQSVINLVVQYAPDVELLVQNATEHDTDLVMTCNASGVPNVYTYGVWTHMYGTTTIRTLSGDVTTHGRTLTLTSVSYQDSGNYICQVQNSIRGRDGQLIQTGTAVFEIKGNPTLLEGGSIDIANRDQPFRKSLIFISNPPPTDMYISRKERLSSTQNLTITFTTETVADNFYGKILTRPGYKVNLFFPTFQIHQIGNYSLTVTNQIDPHFVFYFTIIIIDVPDTPTDLVVDKITMSSAVVSWIPGINRGREDQKFHVWLLQQPSTTWDIKQIPEQTYTLQITNLLPSTTYTVLLFAANEKGNSENSTLQFTTSQQVCDDTCPFYRHMYVTSIVLICVSVIILLINLGIGVFVTRSGHLPFMKKRKMNSPDTSSKPLASIGTSEHAMAEITPHRDRSLYTDLDTTDFTAQNVYDQAKPSHDIGLDERAEGSNYETLEGVSGPNLYEELKGRKGSSSKQIYINTSPIKDA